MPTYLYCVLAPPNADALPRGLTGIADAPVRSLVSAEMGPIEAWVATIDDAALRATGRALAAQALLHNEVVNAAIQTGRTPAPARYGSRFVDDAVCVRDLAGRASELRLILDRVAGAVEMSVLLVPADSTNPPPLKPKSSEPAAGRRYLESIRSRAQDIQKRRAAVEALADRVTRAVEGSVREEARTHSDAGVMSIAHLVAVGDLDRYRAALATVERSHNFRLVVGQPRAPYNFASPRLARGRHDSSSPINND